MIRRLLVFVGLLAVGFLGLHFAVGDQDFAGDQATRRETPTPTPPPDPVRGGVQVGDGDRELMLTLGGEMHFVGTRPVQRGDLTDHQTIYRLECLDSEQVEDHLLRMDEVLVKLYEEGEHVADLTAIQALVEIGRDAQGKPSIRQEKEMDLSQVALWTLPEADYAPLRLETPHARGRITDAAIELHTPTEQEPVLLLVEGDRGGRLTGRGLQALLPRSSGSDPSRIDIEINRSPAISAADGSVELTASGGLKYLESRLDGTFVCQVSDSVALVVSGDRVREAALAEGEGPMAVQVGGDRLSAWGIRRGGSGNGGSGKGGSAVDGQLLLRFVRLEGAPAGLRAPGLHVRASNFALLPGDGPDPVLITASGTIAAMELTDAETGETATFTAGRRIHVVRPAARLQPIYRSFGFPDWSTQVLARRDFIRFEGATTVTTASGLDLEAGKGILLLRPADGEGPLVMRGYGDVDIRQRDGEIALRAVGNQGFTLWRTQGQETLVLGTGEPDSAHVYSIERGELSLRGTGGCRFTRRGEDGIGVHLLSEAPTIAGAFGSDVELQGATELEARLRGEALIAFEASGPDLATAFRREGETFEGRGRRLVQEARDVFRLEGDAERPAVVQRTAGEGAHAVAEWIAPIVHLYRLGARQALLDAEVAAGQEARLRIRQPGRDGGAPLELDLAANHMRLVPYALPPLVVRMHAAWRPAGLADPFARWLRQPILLADGQVVIDTTDPDTEAVVEATGHRFVLATGARTGYLQGGAPEHPATVVRRERDGRELRAQAPAIRVARAGRSERLLLLKSPPFATGADMSPRLYLYDPDPKVNWGSEGPMRLLGTSSGEIAVLPDRVHFEGPVRVQGLLADGRPDPGGPDVRSRELWMTRDPKTGAVTRIDAEGDVRLDWHRVRGRAQTLGLNLAETLCTVAGGDGAEVWMPGLGWMRASRIEADYATLGVRLWNGWLRHARPDRDGARMP